MGLEGLWSDALDVVQPIFVELFTREAPADAVEWLPASSVPAATVALPRARYVSEHVELNPQATYALSTEEPEVHVLDSDLVAVGLEGPGSEVDVRRDRIRVTLKNGQVVTWAISDRRRDGQGISRFKLTKAAS